MKIKKIEFHHFNQRENVYIETEGEYDFPKKEHALKLTGEPGTIHWGMNDDGVVSFGLWYDDPDMRPGHGGYWSSRAGVVGPLIGCDMVPVAINNYSAHMTVPALEKLLPDGYVIVQRSSFDDDEFWFEVQKTKEDDQQ